jgi:hypothetical protein
MAMPVLFYIIGIARNISSYDENDYARVAADRIHAGDRDACERTAGPANTSAAREKYSRLRPDW